MRHVWRRRRSLDVDAPRQRPGASASDERSYTVTCALGGFGLIPIPWSGTSLEDAADSFAQFLTNHDEFAELPEPHLRTYRRLYVRFNGQHRLLTFRTDWITGFTVH